LTISSEKKDFLFIFSVRRLFINVFFVFAYSFLKAMKQLLIRLLAVVLGSKVMSSHAKDTHHSWHTERSNSGVNGVEKVDNNWNKLKKRTFGRRTVCTNGQPGHQANCGKN
tara:strand:+ start:2199 stop:2531 length:333 start_codon:yes stop_codon:yes gene_type:complete